VERAVFDLISLYLRRDREIKVRLYPSLAYAVVFPILALVSEGLPDPFLNAQVSFYGLLGAAMVCFSGLSAVEVLVFSAHYQAAYIFRVTPINRRGDIHDGIRKAVFINIALPSFLALFLLFGFIWRNPLHALLVLVPWIIIMPAVLLVPFTFRVVLPLSRKYQKGQQSARNLSVFIASFTGLSVITGLQIASLKGYLPYWSFILIVAVAAPLIHFILTRVNGEAEPLRPEDGSNESG
jgi:ABC-2 type transport system permease protein